MQETMFDSVRSRLHRDVGKSQPATTPATPTKSTTTPLLDTGKGSGDGNYNLMLGVAGSHSEVYNQTRRLPDAYRDRVRVEPLEGSDSLRITLDVRFTKKQADQLARSIRNTFPWVQVIPAI
jgi:hypothetical protein